MLIRLGIWGVLVYVLWTLSVVVCLVAIILHGVTPEAATTKFVDTSMAVSWALGLLTLVLSKVEMEG